MMSAVLQMEADGLKESTEVRSFMSAATNVDLRDPAGAIRAITASAIGAVAQVRGYSMHICVYKCVSSSAQQPRGILPAKVFCDQRAGRSQAYQ